MVDGRGAGGREQVGRQGDGLALEGRLVAGCDLGEADAAQPAEARITPAVSARISIDSARRAPRTRSAGRGAARLAPSGTPIGTAVEPEPHLGDEAVAAAVDGLREGDVVGGDRLGQLELDALAAASANADVRQAVSMSPSTASAGRSSLVKVIGLPYRVAYTTLPSSCAMVMASSPASGNTGSRLSVASTSSGSLPPVSV